MPILPSLAVPYVVVVMTIWWRHQMQTFSALLASCAGNSPVPGEFLAQRPVTRSFDVFFGCVWINEWVNNREAVDLSRYRAHYDVIVINYCVTRDDNVSIMPTLIMSMHTPCTYVLGCIVQLISSWKHPLPLPNLDVAIEFIVSITGLAYVPSITGPQCCGVVFAEGSGSQPQGSYRHWENTGSSIQCLTGQLGNFCSWKR